MIDDQHLLSTPLSLFQLGYPTKEPTKESWTEIVSRGGLVEATEEVNEWFFKADDAFNVYHLCDKILTGRGIHGRTVKFIKTVEGCEDIPDNFVKLLVKIKINARIKNINTSLPKPGKSQSVRDHMKVGQWLFSK